MDSAIYNGFTVPSNYDSLIGKLIVHADDRQMAIRRLARALDELIIDGVHTTLDLFKDILNEEQFKSGEYNIHWLENWLTESTVVAYTFLQRSKFNTVIKLYKNGIFPWVIKITIITFFGVIH